VKEGRKGLDEVEVEMQQSNEEEMEEVEEAEVEEEEVEEEGRKSLIKGDISSLSTTSLFFEGRMQEDTRARMRTRLTPIAEYQMEETSYKSRCWLPSLSGMDKFLSSYCARSSS